MTLITGLGLCREISAQFGHDKKSKQVVHANDESACQMCSTGCASLRMNDHRPVAPRIAVKKDQRAGSIQARNLRIGLRASRYRSSEGDVTH